MISGESYLQLTIVIYESRDVTNDQRAFIRFYRSGWYNVCKIKCHSMKRHQNVLQPRRVRVERHDVGVRHQVLRRHGPRLHDAPHRHRSRDPLVRNLGSP